MADQRFDRVAVKVLSAVEVDSSRSNQHELNGVAAFKGLLGESRLEKLPCSYRYLTDDPDTTLRDYGWVSWYDSRERNPNRSEHRLYYPANIVMAAASEGDLMVLVRDGETVEIHVAVAGSTAASQLRWLIGLDEGDVRTRVHEVSGLLDRVELLAHVPLFDELGLHPAHGRGGLDLDLLFDAFPSGLPTTAEFAAFARSQVSADVVEDPDEALRVWTSTEEQLFRAIEREEIAARLDDGFLVRDEIDVDGFLAFSLSVHNRRKARAGLSLEHHVRALLDHRRIPYEHEPITENRSKPDFLIPSGRAYHDPAHPVEQLRMLAVKTTCKDRWRQVLAEANRIDRKHLLTLEPAISAAQTEEMKSKRLQLVLPVRLHATYTAEQRTQLLSVDDCLSEFAQI